MSPETGARGQWADAPLDPGIDGVVAWLQSHGFVTTDSGDGVTKLREGPDDCVLPYPHVYMRVDPLDGIREADRLYGLLMRRGVPVREQGPDFSAPSIQLAYDPGNDRATLLLMGLNDDALAQYVR